MPSAQARNPADLAGTTEAASETRRLTGSDADVVHVARRYTFGWKRYVGSSSAVGLAFVVLDALVNANPLAQDAYAPFAPILRPEIDILPASAIDLVYGFALCAIFIILYRVLPGPSPVVKGLSFGVLLWFLRTVMNAAGQWVLFALPLETVTYSIGAGLLEMLALGVLVGLLVQPRSEPTT